MGNPILDRIKRGTADMPPRVLLAGPEGIGKSTFASKAPSPLFIAAEDGLTGLEHISRFPAESTDDIHSLLDGLAIDAAGYRTLVIDTTDWLERLIARSVCKRDGLNGIEDYGYGKGYKVVEEELVKLLQKLDVLRQTKKLGIVLLAHVHIRTFNDPAGKSWDRYEMKGHKTFTGVLREWPDACLFSVREVFKTKAKGDKIEKAVGGDRKIHTNWSPAWDAKNRLNLPDELDMEWDAFQTAVDENSSAALCAKILKLHSTAKLADADKAKWNKALQILPTLTADKLKGAIEKLESLQ